MYITLIIFAKLIALFSKLLKIGSGSSLPGYLILKIKPDVLFEMRSKLPEKVVLVSGTNGKTTTSKILAHILRQSEMSVLHNDSGANLKSGVLSCLLLSQPVFKRKVFDIAVFEVDELTLPYMLEVFEPDVVLLLNLSRDQLDRHWEIDKVYENWRKSLLNIKERPTLVIDGGQPLFTDLAKEYKESVRFFGEDRLYIKQTQLKGSFNARNVNGAVTAAEILGVNEDTIVDALSSFDRAYGRGETLEYRGKNYQIYLAKNPESMNQNLKMIREENIPFDTVLFILNDNIPDGLDVSWIYDIHPGLLNIVFKNKKVFVSGKRAFDMAIRLNYAGVGIEEENIIENQRNCISKLSSFSENRDILVLPNYSAMLEFRRIVKGKSIL